MLRKTLIAIAAAGTMALGMTSMTKPADAQIFLQFGNGYGNGYGYGDGYYGGFHHRFHHGYYGYGHRRCGYRTVRVRHHHRWVLRRIRVCNRYPVY